MTKKELEILLDRGIFQFYNYTNIVLSHYTFYTLIGMERKTDCL